MRVQTTTRPVSPKTGPRSHPRDLATSTGGSFGMKHETVDVPKFQVMW